MSQQLHLRRMRREDAYTAPVPAPGALIAPAKPTESQPPRKKDKSPESAPAARAMPQHGRA